jgi:NAD(P)-dependent dehydrogenase (short-subunit alcohol dehydrogenase family)
MLTNNKVIVAGAGGLLGAEVVSSILQANEQVIAVDISMNAMQSALNEKNVDITSDNITFVELDLTNESAVKAFFEAQDGITGAVNCSYPRNKAYGAALFDVSLANFNENVSLHLGSTFLFSQQCAAYFLRNQQKFSLVNISSIYGVVAPNFSVYENTDMTMPVEYAAIKSAIIHLNKYFAAYIKNSQFRVNSVSPGGLFNEQPAEFLKKYKEQTLGQGMLEIDDILGSIHFLLSEQSQYINGQNIVVDDGFTL